MLTTPKSLRLHIAFFGRRNVGKSSLVNAFTRQQVSIVSPVAGTTTDPVEKPMELLPLGPVVLIDTAGVDDAGSLGALRVEKTRQVFDRTDLAILVVDSGQWTDYEEQLLQELQVRKLAIVVVFNKSDTVRPAQSLLERLTAAGVRTVQTSALSGSGIDDLREAILQAAPVDWIDNLAIVGDLVGAGEMALLVVPIDKEAPRGRLILPQVQVIRDLLDHGASCCVAREHELAVTLQRLKSPPKLVITDSQAFAEVNALLPPEVPLTGFSILMSRFKGDLLSQVRGAVAIDDLRPGDRVLVAEACSHHPIGEDIGRVKIPRWLTNYVGGELRFETVQGRDFPEDLSPYKLVIHCGACTWNRRSMLSRILRCERAGVPITNYGLTIAYSLGMFERTLESFPEALEAWRQACHARQTAAAH